MAFAATVRWNIQTGGNATNGGGFDATSGTPGTDYSQQTSPQVTYTDLVIGVTTTDCTSVATPFTSAHVGNIMNVTSGTGFTVQRVQIMSVSAGVATCDKSLGTTASTGGNAKLGGCWVIGSGDDAFFELGVPGNIFDIKSGSYTLGASVSISAAGGASNPIVIRGYTTNPGDVCTGSNRPLIVCAANAFTVGTNWDVLNIRGTTTIAGGFTCGGASKVKNCKWINSSTTSGRVAITGTADAMIIDCEAVSYRGIGISYGANNGATVLNCIIHDSDIGLQMGVGAGYNFSGNIIHSCVTAAFRTTGATGGAGTLYGNTIFGSVNTTGIGVSLFSGTTDIRLVDNIITGFVTGVSHADTQSVGYDDFNNYYNNDADVSAAGQWQKGPNDKAINPSFANVGQVTFATATTSGSVLTQSGADFTASGVVAGRDYLYLVSGTGITAGIYGITAVGTTTITIDIAPGTNATADKVGQITTGHNFTIGSALKGLGSPGAFQGDYSTSYRDMGAVQRQEAAGGGGMLVHPGMAGGARG